MPLKLPENAKAACASKVETTAEICPETQNKSTRKTSESYSNCDEKTCENEPHFKPLVNLPIVESPTLEEDEDITFECVLARLYRYDTNVPQEFGGSAQWKERGTGTVKLLTHRHTGKTRLVMRRERTLRVCANHYVHSCMPPHAHASAKHTLVWVALADVSDSDLDTDVVEKSARLEGDASWQPQVFALRFKTSAEVDDFLKHFNAARNSKASKSSKTGKSDGVQLIADKLRTVKVDGEQKSNENSAKST